MKLEEQILDTIMEYHKTTGKHFINTILLLPEDYENLKANCTTLQFINSVWTFNGLPLSASTDKDLGWTALEFTGWPKDNPELLTFIDEIDFRNLLYKDKK